MAVVTAIGYTNYFTTGSITANSSATGLGPSNLSSAQCAPSTGWQTFSGAGTSAAGALLRCNSATTAVVWRAIALVNTNLTPSAVITAVWWRAPGPTAVAQLVLGGPQRGYRQVIGVLPADIIADFVQIQFDDPTNPDQNINIGGAFSGPMWFPQLGISWESSYGSTAPQIKSVSRGGQEYRNQLYRQRFWKLALTGVRDIEAWDNLGELDRISSLGGNVLFIPNTSLPSADIYRETVFGALDPQSDVTFPHTTTDARAWRAQISERL